MNCFLFKKNKYSQKINIFNACKEYLFIVVRTHKKCKVLMKDALFLLHLHILAKTKNDIKSF